MNITLKFNVPAFSKLRIESVAYDKFNNTIYVLSNIAKSDDFGMTNGSRLCQTIDVDLAAGTNEPEVTHFVKYTDSDFQMSAERIQQDKQEWEKKMEERNADDTSLFYSGFNCFKERFSKANPSFLAKNFLVIEGDSDLELFENIRKHGELEFRFTNEQAINKPAISVTNYSVFQSPKINQQQQQWNNQPQQIEAEDQGYYGYCVIS